MRRLKAKLFNRAKGWRFAGTPAQGDVLPHWECNYWSVCSKSDGTIELLEPLYGQPFQANIYTGEHQGRVVKFAFTEISNGVFAVFEPA
ncbi:MAG: hypothetical protein ABJP48_12360 [Erythrobacter sp.]